MNSGRSRVQGFTLLEVLVALAIFAIVAAVVLTAAGRSVNNAGRLETLTLAGWIADNRPPSCNCCSRPLPSAAKIRSWNSAAADGRP